MVGYDNGIYSMFDRELGIFEALHALHDDWFILPPDVSNPGQMLPGDDGSTQLSPDICVWHRLSVVQNDIPEFHHPAIRVKTLQPGQMRDHLWPKLQLLKGSAINRLVSTHPFMLCAITRHCRINGENQSRVACVFCSLDASGRNFFAANEIQLIPTWAF